MKSKQFTAHELSIMLLAFDMALHDITKFEKEAKRQKDKDRRYLCQVMFLQIHKIRQKADGLLHDTPALVSIDGGRA